ncbi:MAG: hypothetical protein ACYDCO_27835 [Armatimonadota bacterium]
MTVVTTDWRVDVAGAEARFAVRLAEAGAVCRLGIGDVELSLTERDGDIAIRIGGDEEAGTEHKEDRNRLTYDLRAYDTILPTWSDAVRRPIERDMAGLPLATEKWVRVRVQAGTRGKVAAGRVRVWVDDRLLVDREAGGNAELRLDLDAGARVTGMRVQPLPEATPGFEPIALDGYARDRKLVRGKAVADEALPFGRLARVQGVPFLFPERKQGGPDHLDIGRSLCRQGAMEGYCPAFGPRYAGSLTVDPARIQLRIPNGRYDALYVIAGCAPGPRKTPTLSAAFYRPGVGFAQCFATAVHSLDESGEGAVPVTLEDGSAANLWLVKIPLDPARLSSFSDLETLELELTKEIRQYRSYPDPFLYGWHGAGRPSGVHVYAVTLHKPDVELSLEPAVFGHVWTAPEVPEYEIALANRTAEERTVTLTARASSHDGQEAREQAHQVTVPAEGRAVKRLAFPVEKNGLHTLEVTIPGWTETRHFCRLAPDTRAPHWTEGEGPLFGYWSYHGGHGTPPAAEIMRVMRAAGARTSVKMNNAPELQQAYRWPASSSAWPVKPQWEWAGEDPVDPEKYAAYQQYVIEEIRTAQGDHPDFVTFFPEPHISRALGAGVPADYLGEKYELTEQEQTALRVFWNTAKAAAEAVRREWPNTKILIPWGDPLFIVPFLRAGFPRELLDGCGLDMIGFERLPEQQVFEQSNHRLWVLREEFRRAGYEHPELYYIEGVFVPTEPGGATWQEQAERYHRWTLLSLANGVERFYSGWFAFDCGDWYGAEHYGGCGIQRRLPYCDPKPAYAHFATMTRLLERTQFARYVPTGSHGVYCLEFAQGLSRPRRTEASSSLLALGNEPSGTVPSYGQADQYKGTVPLVPLTGGNKDAGSGPAGSGQSLSVYVLWTVRGTRPVTLLGTADEFTLIDSMDNGVTVRAGEAITVGTSPVYVTGAGEVTGIMLGEPDHADAVAWSRGRNRETWHDGPAVPEATTVEKNLGSLAKWTLGGPDEAFETHNYDDPRFFGNFTTRVSGDAERDGQFLAVHLGEQPVERPLASWYAALEPPKPLVIPGKACALGLWVKAHADWTRLAFLLRDARGERWLSCGMKDVCNANELHGWLSCGFDGWRYLRMELPANSEYDGFREFGSTWWGADGDGIVDLPLTVEKIFVMRRTHVVYVNDLQPADPSDLLLGELIAEYDAPVDATPAAVKLNRMRMPLPAGAAGARNPIAEMQANPLPAVTLLGVRNPDWGYDGTVCHVDFTEAPGAAEYQVWVAAYPDGRGAVPLGKMPAPGGLLRNLRPGRQLHLWVTYAAEGGESRPSNGLAIELVDAFVRK